MKKSDDRQYTFWIGYSDLMTNLFFIFLVLFVVFYISFQQDRDLKEKVETLLKENKDLKKKANTLIEIEDDITKKFKADNDFIYDINHKRFELKRQPKFADRSSQLTNIDDIQYLISIGKKLMELIASLNLKNGDVQYMLIIEGMSSADGYPGNEELSFQRALAVYNLWQNSALKNQIDMFNKRKICKFQIVGSGKDTRGWGRISSYEKYLEDQKIVIYLIPYVSYNKYYSEKGTQIQKNN